MISWIFTLWFKLKGWQTGEPIPADIKKCVIIAAPHTSNWDFVYALAAFKLFGIKLNYLAKKQLFWWPLSILLKNTGGMAVDRSKHNNLVDNIAKLYEENEKMMMIFPAEGTRSAVEKWKTGFYHVAVKTGVPVFMGYLDYHHKKAGFGPMFQPSGNIENDFEVIRNFYLSKHAKNEYNFNRQGIKPN